MLGPDTHPLRFITGGCAAQHFPYRSWKLTRNIDVNPRAFFFSFSLLRIYQFHILETKHFHAWQLFYSVCMTCAAHYLYLAERLFNSQTNLTQGGEEYFLGHSEQTK